jgi:uncharacterized protein YndB with AHSA1/START domain
MPMTSGSRELLAPREDVWAFVSEPHRLTDWWPGVTGVMPDRRGFAAGARWAVTGDNRPSLLRKPNMSGALVVVAVERPSRFAFQLTGERMEAELRLEEAAPDRTLAHVTVTGPALIGLRRSLLPQKALARLYDLCQTAAED